MEGTEEARITPTVLTIPMEAVTPGVMAPSMEVPMFVTISRALVGELKGVRTVNPATEDTEGVMVDTEGALTDAAPLEALVVSEVLEAPATEALMEAVTAAPMETLTEVATVVAMA